VGGGRRSNFGRPCGGQVPALQVRRAATAWLRLRGLLGRSRLAPGQALWLDPCRAVHTLGMRYAIDVAFIDRQGRVVRIVHGLRPWRWAGGWRARSAVELAAGEAADARGGAARIEAALHRWAEANLGQDGLNDRAKTLQRRARTR